LIPAALGLLVLLFFLIPKLKPVGEEKIPEASPSFHEDTGLAPPETRYFRIALDYMAGRGGLAAKNIQPPEPLVTAEPSGCNVETNIGEYFYKADEDQYILPLENMAGVEKRPVVKVTCQFNTYPNQIEVVIDSTNDKITQWTLGQR